MEPIAGVKTELDNQGKLASITINLKKHPKAVEALKAVGLLEKSPLQMEMEANPENFIPIDQARESSLKELRKTWDEWKMNQ